MQYIRWIPVAERTPDQECAEYRERYGEGTDAEFIVYIRDAEIPTMLAYDGRGFYIPDDGWDDGDHEYLDVTHWMHMPPRPDKCLIDIDLGDQFEANYELLEAIFLPEV